MNNTQNSFIMYILFYIIHIYAFVTSVSSTRHSTVTLFFVKMAYNLLITQNVVIIKKNRVLFCQKSYVKNFNAVFQ